MADVGGDLQGGGTAMVKREELRGMRDAWRAYLDLALGLTEASRKKATEIARDLVGRGGASAGQVQAAAEDLIKSSLANREALARLVRAELERAVSRLGLATSEEVSQLTTRVRRLEEQAGGPRVVPAAPTPATPPDQSTAPAPGPAAGAQTTVTRPAAGKAAPRKAAPRKAVTGKAAEKAVPRKAAAAKKATPRKESGS